MVCGSITYRFIGCGYIVYRGRRKQTLYLYVVTATNLSFRLKANVETSHSVRYDLVVVVMSIMGGSKKFSHGMVRSRKPPLRALTITATLFSYQGTYTIQHRCMALDSIPRPLIESIDDLLSTNELLRTDGQRANIRPLLTPRAIARGACGHSPLTIKYQKNLAAWTTPYGFPISS